LQKTLDTRSKDLEDCKAKLLGRPTQEDLDKLQKTLDTAETDLRSRSDNVIEPQLHKSREEHDEVKKQLSDATEQLKKKTLDLEELQTAFDQQRTELKHRIGELRDTQKKLHRSQDEVRARPSAAIHSNVKDSLDAVTEDRNNLVIKLARAEADARDRPTEVEHQTLQIELGELRSDLSKRPTHSTHEMVKKSLETAEQWSRHWRRKYNELADQQLPSAAEEQPWEKEALKQEIAFLTHRIERRDASLEEIKGHRNQLGEDIARIQGEKTLEEAKQKKLDNERRQEVAGLRKSLKAAEELVRSTTEELTKCKSGAMESSRYIQDSLDEGEISQDGLDVEMQLDDETRRATDAHQKIEDLTYRFRQIGMYNLARSQVLQFLYGSLGLVPNDDFMQDTPELVLQITKRQLEVCTVTKDGIDQVHKAKSDNFEAVSARLESIQEHFELVYGQWKDAKSTIASLNEDVSRYKKYATTQEAGHRQASKERDRLARALFDTKIRFNRLTKTVEEATRFA
jgi:chromosome segregation ATPase